MHSAELSIHLQGEIPKVVVKDYSSFYTVELCFDKYTIKFFINSEQELINFKNQVLWAFEKPLKM